MRTFLRVLSAAGDCGLGRCGGGGDERTQRNAILAVAAVGGGGGGGGGGGPVATSSVSVGDDNFTPNAIVVSAGDDRHVDVDRRRRPTM